MKTATYRLVDASEVRLVVSSDEQFELRRKLEIVESHEARRYPVAAGQRLDARLSPASAFFRFDGGDESSALQPGEASWMLVAIRYRETFDCRCRVLAGGECPRRSSGGPISRCGLAVTEEQRVFARVAG